MPSASTLTPAHRYRLLWQLMAGFRLRYAGAMGAMALGIALSFSVPLVVGFTIDHVLKQQPLGNGGLHALIAAWLGSPAGWGERLWLVGLAVLSVTALAGAFLFLEGLWAGRAAEGIARRLRNQMYDHLQHATADWHDHAQTGDTVQRCTSDVETVHAFLATQVVAVVRACGNLAVALPVMFWMQWDLALIATCVMPVVVVFSVVFFRVVQNVFKDVDEAEGALTARVQENLTNVRVVRAFNRRAFEMEKFDQQNAKHRRHQWRMLLVFAWYWSLTDGLVFVQMGLALFVGAHAVAGGTLPVGELVAFWMYVGLVSWPVRQMGRTLSELGKALVALQRVGEVLDAPVETDSPPAADPAALPERVTGRLVVEGLCFKHADQAVLHDVSFALEPGETLAVLGASGSGKSTLINLLLRFYDPNAGAITLDGHDLTRLPRADARSQLGAVMQEPFLYSKTLRGNLTIGRHAAPDADMVAVARTAAVHDAIEGFDHGYDTRVGERGVTLSGGQRQRVAIARALLQDKPVMLLDDAFSAVDTRTEADILAALRNRKGRATTILIAHRLSTLMHADRVIVLEHGRVTQRGTHDELIQAPGLYQRLWRTQTDPADGLAPDPAPDLVTDLASNLNSDPAEGPL